MRLIANAGGWRDGVFGRSRLLDVDRLKRLFSVNTDILIRTLALLILLNDPIEEESVWRITLTSC